jgi:hypothetical protein
MKEWRATSPISAPASIVDSAVLTVLVTLSLALYLPRLGFYSDDWAFLSKLNLAADQSMSGLYHAVKTPITAMRPVQMYYLAALYSVFGLSPLGYHLVNAAVFSAGIVLFYLTLRKLQIPRLFATSIALVYGLLPHYSTDRFWVAAFQANLSMTLYFAGTYFLLQAARTRGWHVWTWQVLSLIAVLGSALAYEVFLPLLMVNVALVWYHLSRIQGARFSTELRRRFALLAGSQMLAFFTAGAFKAATTVRMGDEGVGFLRHVLSIGRRALSLHVGGDSYGFNIRSALDINYGRYTLGLPLLVIRAVRDSTPAILALTVVCTSVVFAWIYHLACNSSENIFSRKALLITGLSGFTLFWLGYAVFLTNYNVGFSTTGIANRTAIAAGVGFAVSMIGAGGWVCSAFSRAQIRRFSFSAFIAALCGAGFLLINVTALFWTKAYERQQELVARIRERLPELTPDSTLILDGACPYVGPAIVFESPWDLAGALAILYHNQSRSLKADVVTRNVQVEPTGISTTIYNMRQFYPYSGKLLIYNDRLRIVRPLTDVVAARLYFRSGETNCDRCPRGRVGHGVPIFD